MAEHHHRVIFDTDIGTDVDDILALAVLLGSDNVTIEGVTTVYGDVGLRARIVSKILKLRGVMGVPICKGVQQPLLQREAVFWPGHEGIGLLEERDDLPAVSDQHAIDFLIETVLRNPGEITLLAVGPLSNVAVAILREPSLAKHLKRLIIMGGRLGLLAGTFQVAEHNIKCDPEAAQIVFSSGAQIELVPLDVTLRARIRQDGVDQIRKRSSPYHEALADQVALYPGFIERAGETFLHDPLAALAVVRPELLTWHDTDISVELDGTSTRAMTIAVATDSVRAPRVRVALDLDVEACEQEILTRMTR